MVKASIKASSKAVFQPFRTDLQHASALSEPVGSDFCKRQAGQLESNQKFAGRNSQAEIRAITNVFFTPKEGRAEFSSSEI